ncbi:hypothetical protein BJX68DRAFT_264474 [Aspergillus pseudodeflectus]|uniref:F-box domain-containing protein n=1 Tax=Aspergillus pseudodeflectus TaxID=176178 RepID=A0ABR4KQN3_9EURO
MARSLAHLPAEIIIIIASCLPNSGIKTLRLTCKTLCNTVRLRLDRAFLSANPLNITVFRAIADSETFRHGVRDIIWDDARLVKDLWGEFHIADPREDLWTDEESGAPLWFVDACKENIKDVQMRKMLHVYCRRTPPEPVLLADQIASDHLPIRICWQYYQNLLQQQEDVIVFNRDAEAFTYGLQRFPALTRVTVTAAAHGWIYAPLALGDEATREDYRGVCIAMHALATYSEHHQVTELRLDAHTLETGLNCRMFEEPNKQYNDFAAILNKPDFARLDLSLLVRGQERTGWRCFRSGCLRRALAGAPDIQHISLTTNVDSSLGSDSSVPGSAGSREQLVPLHTIFPAETWRSLQHFSLSKFLVEEDDIVSFLSSLPDTLRSVHLGFLYFVNHGGTYGTLLEDMRDKLDWRSRPSSDLPVVTIALPTEYIQVGHAIWLDKEVREFLYADGANPFWNRGNGMMKAGVVRDAFIPGVHWAPYDVWGGIA